MSSRAKHAQRSHKTFGKNHNVYQRSSEKLPSKKYDLGFFERIKNLFKHQDR